MTGIEILLVLLIIFVLLPRGHKPQPRARYVRLHSTDIGPPPVTPGPRYICANCGMLIETGHGHTREECAAYAGDSTKPDLRAHRQILPGRNDPKIRPPYYYEPGSFRNWGAGRIKQ